MDAPGPYLDAAKFPALHTVLCVCPVGAGTCSDADIAARRGAHRCWVAALAPQRDKLLAGTPLTRADMELLRATWSKHMGGSPAPYVPVRAVIDPAWAVRAVGTSALCHRDAAPDCPHRDAMLQDAARGCPRDALPAARGQPTCTVCDGNAALGSVRPAHTLCAMASMALADRPWSEAPVHGHGCVG